MITWLNKSLNEQLCKFLRGCRSTSCITSMLPWNMWVDVNHRFHHLAVNHIWKRECPSIVLPLLVSSWARETTARRGGLGQWRWFGTPDSSQERHFVSVTFPAWACVPIQVHLPDPPCITVAESKRVAAPIKIRSQKQFGLKCKKKIGSDLKKLVQT